MPQRLTNNDFLYAAPHFSIIEKSIYIASPLHWHEFFEMEFILQGRGSHIINGTSYPLTDGMLFLLTPSDFHEIIPDEGTIIHLMNIKFSDYVISDEIREMLISGDRYIYAYFENSSFTAIKSEILRLKDEYINPEIGSHFIIKGSLERILIDLIRCSGFCNENKNDCFLQNNRNLLQKAFNYIYHHFRENITLEDAADKSYLSTNYFSKCFHKEAGISFQSYLLGLRLEFARSLLSVSKLPVTEICFASGFNSLPYFIRKFKKTYGKSPSEFRRSIS